MMEGYKIHSSGMYYIVGAFQVPQENYYGNAQLFRSADAQRDKIRKEKKSN